MYIIFIILAFYVGAVFGSFASMATYRLVESKPFFTKRSYCPVCRHSLKAKDLVPLFSWLFLRGQCRYCHAPIKWHYLVTELLLGVVFLLVYFRFGISWGTLLLWGVAVCLAILVKVDFEKYFLPDSVQLALLGFALWYTWLNPTGLAPLIGAFGGLALGFMLRLVGYALKKQEAFGWGDVKFLGIAGVFLGTSLDLIAIFFFLSGVLGMATALLWHFLGKGNRFPFGPALAMALFLCLVFPEMGEVIQTLAYHLASG